MGNISEIFTYQNGMEDYKTLSEAQIIDMVESDRGKYVKGSGYYSILTYILWIIRYLNKCRKSGEIEKKEPKPKIKL